MNFGLPEKTYDMIVKVLDEMKEIEKADIFGSRAMGNYKKGSDVDLAIYGEEVTPDIVNKISIRLNEELPIPYYFDVVHYERLNKEELKAHIDKYGKLLYQRMYENLV